MRCSSIVAGLLLFAVAIAPVVARSPTVRTWSVDGVERQGLVYLPETKEAASWPLVFAFHGHGGTMQQAARSLAFHDAWPEACVVYLQGLPTPGQLTDPEGRRNGWQAGPGDQGDRDLAFFDTVLSDLRGRHPIDDRRVYATGHSNGGGFTYLLWATRRDVFAAFGPSSAVPHRNARALPPAPVLHVAGKADALVRFAWQEQTIDRLRRAQRCEDGQPQPNGSIVYPSPLGPPVAVYLHDGGHRYPAQATAIVVDFFKSHARPEGRSASLDNTVPHRTRSG